MWLGKSDEGGAGIELCLLPWYPSSMMGLGLPARQAFSPLGQSPGFVVSRGRVKEVGVLIFEAWSQAKIGQRVRRSSCRDNPETWLIKGAEGVCIAPHELLFSDWEIVEEIVEEEEN